LNGADLDHPPILPEPLKCLGRYNPCVLTKPLSQAELRLQKSNFRYVQIDAVGVSISNVAAPFLPVFLTRLGASNFQVGLLSSMPGVTGLILAIVVGRFLQSRENIVPWYSLSRLMVILCYALTGILTLLIAEQYAIIATLAIWAFATIPQTALAVAFSVVMNGVAGPAGRYALLSRRWTIFGLTGVIGTFIVTRLIDLIDFPVNYAIMFLVLSLGGFVSFYFSRKITLPDQVPPPVTNSGSSLRGFQNVLELLRSNPAFLSFSLKRFVYFSAITLGTPIMPLFLVREVLATDGQIGTVNMTLTLVMLVGYFLWPRVSLKRSGRFVLLATTLGAALYPALSAATPRIELIILYAGIAGFFQGGLDLVFFDELMKTVPVEYSATFVSISQSMQYLSMILAPLLGTWLAGYIGLGGALWLSAGLRFFGFLLFLMPDRKQTA
jgi:MFS family permease